MHFRNSQSHTAHRINVSIDNVPIIEKKATKFLGVILDSNLTWNEHLKKNKYFCFQGNRHSLEIKTHIDKENTHDIV